MTAYAYPGYGGVVSAQEFWDRAFLAALPVTYARALEATGYGDIHTDDHDQAVEAAADVANTALQVRLRMQDERR